jgi:hypothetical protein
MPRPRFINTILIAGLAIPSLFADAPKPEGAKKPCLAPAVVKTPEPVAPPPASIRDFFDPGFGRKSLDLGLAAKRPPSLVTPKS